MTVTYNMDGLSPPKIVVLERSMQARDGGKNDKTNPLGATLPRPPNCAIGL